MKIEGDKIIVGIWFIGHDLEKSSEPHPYQPSFLNDEIEDDKFYEIYERGCMCVSSDIELVNNEFRIRKLESEICDKRKEIDTIGFEIVELGIKIEKLSKEEV